MPLLDEDPIQPEAQTQLADALQSLAHEKDEGTKERQEQGGGKVNGADKETGLEKGTGKEKEIEKESSPAPGPMAETPRFGGGEIH